jgi:hypothetical protein
MAQVIESLPSKSEAQNSNPSTTKRKEEEKVCWHRSQQELANPGEAVPLSPGRQECSVHLGKMEGKADPRWTLAGRAEALRKREKCTKS